ncbi:aspartate carbamoyltransferase [Nitrosomonas communis]|uniref:Aspartate carbamoyltransferase n=1 Tax=Nitrosomonas communis TaxID=44574 RepID=A0A1I4QCR4_9PROT|nr:aspartate carbamoyltransferase [Nitrosomonas communis]SFM37827.1 hypothetical protein SAMN05421863_10266 [Nitrosomonas communis]
MNKLFIATFLLSSFIAAPVCAAEAAEEKRLDEVAERGAHVMPFDLEKTLHIFTKTENGGLQQVVVKDKSDTEQIRLIQSHLSKISAEFKRRDFSNPEQIHGESMPGLVELKKAKPGEIEIEYSELPNGAQIDYSSNSPKLIDAIHQWFDAQLSEHARHAISGENHQYTHH